MPMIQQAVCCGLVSLGFIDVSDLKYEYFPNVDQVLVGVFLLSGVDDLQNY